MRFKRISLATALASLLVASQLLGGGVVSADSSSEHVLLDRSLRVHPQLQYGAQVEPTKVVRVLVQKASAAINSHDIASGTASAQVREDFNSLGTSVLELQQKDVLQLAKDPRVLYVSPDNAVNAHLPLADMLTGSKLVMGSTLWPSKRTTPAPDTSKLQTTYPVDVNASLVWTDKTTPATGAGVTVAVLDSGINPLHPDLLGKVTPIFVNPQATGYFDGLGHGTHVTGIIDGESSDDHYVGVAPDAHVISVKVADDKGDALESDLLRGIQWVYDNHATHNIKIVNISMSSGTPDSYRASPVDAAVELLWQAGVTVVTSAGNLGTATDAAWYAPGNDPFVITVGCLDDTATGSLKDAVVCSFSSRGQTQDGVTKPDLVAPGRKIVAPLAAHDSVLAVQYPDRVTADGAHIRLSGTSMSAPVVSGGAALLLQRYPNLTPNQLKWLLTSSTRTISGDGGKARVLDVAAAFRLAAGGKIGSADRGLVPAPMLTVSSGGTVAPSSFWNNSFWNNSFWNNSFWNNTYGNTSYQDDAGTFD